MIEGVVMPVSSKEADAYWKTRPRESQIGAWASFQSQKLDHRDTLEKRFIDFDKKFSNKNIPRPPHWSGFRVIPNRIEFWKAKPFRLHERLVYEHKGETWQKGFLFP